MNYSFNLADRNTLLINYVNRPEPSRDQFSTHVHSSYELLYILSADATYIIEGKKYKLKKDDLIIVRPGNYHLIQFDAKVRYERYVAFPNHLSHALIYPVPAVRGAELDHGI